MRLVRVLRTERLWMWLFGICAQGVCGCGYQQKKRGVDVAARGMGSVEVGVGVGVRREVVLRVVRVCKAIFHFYV